MTSAVWMQAVRSCLWQQGCNSGAGGGQSPCWQAAEGHMLDYAGGDAYGSGGAPRLQRGGHLQCLRRRDEGDCQRGAPEWEMKPVWFWICEGD